MGRRIVIELNEENENMPAEEIAEVLNEVGNLIEEDYTSGLVGATNVSWAIEDDEDSIEDDEILKH